MQIMIDIDEETYSDIKNGKIYSSIRDVPLESVVAIANGTPLLEGHGRWINRDALIEKLRDMSKKQKYNELLIRGFLTVDDVIEYIILSLREE